MEGIPTPNSNRSKQRKILIASPLKNQVFTTLEFPRTAQKSYHERSAETMKVSGLKGRYTPKQRML
jgi:hypothetical protein